MGQPNPPPVTGDRIRWVRVRNDETFAAPPFAFLEPTGVDSATSAITVQRPTVSDATALLVNGPVPIGAGLEGQAHASYPAIVAYDQGEGAADPEPGETWGVESGSWTLQEGRTGFTIVGGSGGGLTNVMPAPPAVGAASSGPITSVQTSDGGGGFRGDSSFTWNAQIATLTAEGGSTATLEGVREIFIGAPGYNALTTNHLAYSRELSALIDTGVATFFTEELQYTGDGTTKFNTYRWRAATGNDILSVQASDSLGANYSLSLGGGLLVVNEAADALTLGDVPDSVGFFGSQGTVKPNVGGDVAGNAALTSLIAALAGMNQISDATSDGGAPDSLAILYTPGTSADWSGDPPDAGTALDRLAAAVAGLLAGPVP